jgi:hypothetical protein
MAGGSRSGMGSARPARSAYTRDPHERRELRFAGHWAQG